MKTYVIIMTKKILEDKMETFNLKKVLLAKMFKVLVKFIMKFNC